MPQPLCQEAEVDKFCDDLELLELTLKRCFIHHWGLECKKWEVRFQGVKPNKQCA